MGFSIVSTPEENVVNKGTVLPSSEPFYPLSHRMSFSTNPRESS